MISADAFDPEEVVTSPDALVSGVIRVVVADDDDDIRRLVVLCLRSDGYEVLEAKNGIQLLGLLAAKNAPHIVISDVRMPGVDGLTMLAAMRSAGLRMPIILMSAHCDADVHEEARACGADVFFDKPFDMDDLRTAVLNLRPRKTA